MNSDISTSSGYTSNSSLSAFGGSEHDRSYLSLDADSSSVDSTLTEFTIDWKEYPFFNGCPKCVIPIFSLERHDGRFYETVDGDERELEPSDLKRDWASMIAMGYTSLYPGMREDLFNACSTLEYAEMLTQMTWKPNKRAPDGDKWFNMRTTWIADGERPVPPLVNPFEDLLEEWDFRSPVFVKSNFGNDPELMRHQSFQAGLNMYDGIFPDLCRDKIVNYLIDIVDSEFERRPETSYHADQAEDVLTEQAGLDEDREFELIEVQRNFLTAVRQMGVRTQFTSALENIITTATILFGCKTWSGQVASVIQFVKLQFGVSVSQWIEDYIRSIDQSHNHLLYESGEEPVKVPAKGYYETFTDNCPSGLDIANFANDNWDRIINSPGFTKLQHLLGVVVAAGLCKESRLSFTYNGIKMFNITRLSEQKSIFDVLHGTLDTAIFFIERGWMCFTKCAMSPLLFADTRAERFEEKFVTCQACAMALPTGNIGTIIHVEEGEEIVMTERLYNEYLYDIKEEAKMLNRMNRNHQQTARHYQHCLKMITSWESEYRIHMEGNRLREAPFCIGLFGSSSVGKSSVASILTYYLLAARGESNDPRYVKYVSEEKFDTTIRSDTLCLIFDDIGNVKKDFVTEPSTNKFLKYANNTITFANKAAVEEKSKCLVNPLLMLLTRNIEDMGSKDYSNSPFSINRRENFTLTCKAHPKFNTEEMLDREKIRRYCADLGENQIPDLWLFDIKRAHPSYTRENQLQPDVKYVIEHFQGKQMENVGLLEVLCFLEIEQEKYIKAQREFLARDAKLGDQMSQCPDTGKVRLTCPCDACKDYSIVVSTYKPPILEGGCFGRVAKQVVDLETKAYSDFSEIMNPKSPDEFEDALQEEAGDSNHRGWGKLRDTIRRRRRPRDNRLIQQASAPGFEGTTTTERLVDNFIGEYVSAKSAAFYRKCCENRYTTVAATFLLGMVSFPMTACLSLSVGAVSGWSYWYRKRQIFARIMRDPAWRAILATLAKNEAKKVMSRWIGPLAAVAAFVALVHIFKDKRQLGEQKLEPVTKKEVEEKSAQEDKKFAEVKIDEVPRGVQSSTTTWKNFSCLCAKNLVAINRCTIDNGNMEIGSELGNILVLTTDTFLMPGHFMRPGENRFYCRRNGTVAGTHFTIVADKVNSYRVPNRDLVIVRYHAGGDFADLTKYLTDDGMNKSGAIMVYKSIEGVITKAFTQAKRYNFTDPVGVSCDGYSYTLPFITFKGLCGAVVYTSMQPIILGIHTHGVAPVGKESTVGASTRILLQDYKNAEKHFAELITCQPSVEADTFPEEHVGERLHVQSRIHEKSFLTDVATVEPQTFRVIGSVNTRVKHWSKVKQTLISEDVAEVCKVPQQWGAPHFHLGRAYTDFFTASTDVVQVISPAVLERACRDWLTGFIRKLGKHPKLLNETRTLDLFANVNGIPGVRFIDAIKVNTSCGFPLRGAKSRFMREMDPEELPDGYDFGRELDSRFIDEMDRARERLRQGKRVYFVFNSTPKDEPTKLDKEKVRLFQASPLVLTLLLRQYFLPITRLLHLFPLTAENLIGIDGDSKEWSELHAYLRDVNGRNEENRILAGDYSKWDQRLPSHLISGAYSVLLEVAKLCDYSEDDLLVMRGLVTECLYPVLNLNGDIVQMQGIMPSGISLTAVVNGISNSLAQRCHFFRDAMIYRNFRWRKCMDINVEFRQYVHSANYGDDTAGCVSRDVRGYNHLTYRDFLAEIGMVFTMPDKLSTPTEFMHLCDVDFLKRKFVYNKDFGCVVGPKDTSSIFKSLHACIKSKAITREEHAIAVIDGAQRDFLFHGREVFERRRTELKEIAHKHDIEHLIPTLRLNFDEAVQTWKENQQ